MATNPSKQHPAWVYRYLDVGVCGPFFEPVDFTEEPRVTYCHSGIHIHRKGDGTDDYYFDHVVYDEVRIRWEDGREEKTKLHTVHEIQHVLTHEFRLPHLPLREAIGVLTSLGIDTDRLPTLAGDLFPLAMVFYFLLHPNYLLILSPC